ncbi:N-acetylglucosamine-specific PTS transporter subunit IIBC [Brachyspira hyodysenteriae]|uniref:N-acetylglucosamine-specific PTS transporter subunit IIBC n=1 Tax=Brachyspira hyodysenteriae TaxID=159 RepID=UPI0022CD602B|nr:N-acetylglucosamine-specific PTS transporter subunit IIBC [Brachyspira hyodysenteriae]MCZ9839875.1 N-acetylglucosamine-specific PTS transporter subunit IIBC [Brachyspira hyodysenteriae]MCZ9848277.1 N-acetylglucosamine-specific PTS transporter subunit IIBC [Brachyspira hyodysenteriae]MCZ9851948.1 N-acetylglucosamine-specific PTS transporter subunit IIBC [Brachyspira hyodysenteriae]MCZ9861573.1 N-acetylglucosamine-specific PTS transporter subunit IIBC [Brachyspira hyodysenteriae]MCZ9868806.1 
MFNYLQRIGKSLMVPVAVLPAAAILLGIGYWIDPNGWGGGSPVAAFFIKAGGSIIDNMPILFAIGVAFGMSKDRNGSAALAGLVAFLVVTTLLAPATVGMIQSKAVEDVPAGFAKINNQFIGILCGVIAGGLYNKFSEIKLPEFLAFFSGRRFVPIITSVVMMVVSFILMVIWPAIYGGLVAFGEAIIGLGPIGAGIYGFFNRLLIPVGLHHALNSVFWFDVAGINDIPNFLGGQASIDAGTATIGVTGMYQAGFFPIMMFGLLGACLAFIKNAKPENRNKIKSIMLAAGFASFFTGVTEPIEFSFMFVAPVLYVIHALLTCISLIISASFKWMAGFGFSAGLIDLLLSTKNPLACNWYMLIIQGLVFFVLYFVIFNFAIQKFNLKTPGREDDDEAEVEITVSGDASYAEKALMLLPLLGGIENIVDIDNCATRLRLEVKDNTIIQAAEIKKIFPGVLTPGKTSVQVIVGPKVQFLADEFKKVAKK